MNDSTYEGSVEEEPLLYAASARGILPSERPNRLAVGQPDANDLAIWPRVLLSVLPRSLSHKSGAL